MLGSGDGFASDSVGAGAALNFITPSLRARPPEPLAPSSLSVRRSKPSFSQAARLGIPSITESGDAAKVCVVVESEVAVRKIERTQTDFKCAERRPVIGHPSAVAPPHGD